MRVTLPENGGIGAEITGLKITSVSAEQIASIKDLVYAHKLVIFREQSLSADEYLAFACKVGRPQTYFQPRYHLPSYPEIFVSANVPQDGKKVGVSGTGRYWHTDYQFFAEPLPLTMVYPQQLPRARRETYYIDMENVYRRLPDDLRKRIAHASFVHEGRWRYKIAPEDIDRALIDIFEQMGKEVPAVVHPAVIEHPVTGRKSLYASEGFTTGVVGASHEESKTLLNRLFQFIAQEQHIYTHAYRDGDILFWDNRPLLHKASTVPKGEPSVNYRIGVYDDLPFYLTQERLPERMTS